MPFPSPGDLPDPGIKLVATVPPALAGGFFYHWVTWEAISVTTSCLTELGYCSRLMFLLLVFRFYFSVVLGTEAVKHFAISMYTFQMENSQEANEYLNAVGWALFIQEGRGLNKKDNLGLLLFFFMFASIHSVLTCGTQGCLKGIKYSVKINCQFFTFWESYQVSELSTAIIFSDLK